MRVSSAQKLNSLPFQNMALKGYDEEYLRKTKIIFIKIIFENSLHRYGQMFSRNIVEPQ